PAAVPVGFPRGGEGGGRGGPPEGPLVMPGSYSVRVTVPGLAPMNGKVLVEADPLPKFTAADRAARQAVLMRIYEWTKALGAARAVARSLVGQRESFRADLGPAADSLNARVGRAATSIDRAF